MRRTPSRLAITLLALLLAALVGLRACGDAGDSHRVAIHVGAVLPASGSLSSIGLPMLEAVRLAESDIRAAGGLLTITHADSGTDPAAAPAAVDWLLGEGVEAIVGAGASGVSQSFIETLYRERIPQCSGSNTSPAFSTQESAAYYIRTVPSDRAIAPLLAGLITDDGHGRVAIVARDDDWGRSLAGELARRLSESGVDLSVILYDPRQTTFDGEIAAVASSGAEAVVNLVFAEGVSLIRGLLDAGYGPHRQYLGNGLADPDLARLIDPDDATVVDGLRLVQPATRGSFNERITVPTPATAAYPAAVYDCVVLLTLAAEIAGSVDGERMMEALSDVTRHGTQCRSYGECSDLIRSGVEIDYVGVSGPIDFDGAGDVTVATYAVVTYRNGEFTTLALRDVALGPNE
ncbi:MAG: ABC transporter substrate-binding protein [Chloroflexi bacterium]|nr:ABC transporter substrate-binding protein [Chloroflexota bacterium]